MQSEEDIWSIYTAGHEQSADGEKMSQPSYPIMLCLHEKVVPGDQLEHQEILTDSTICNYKCIQINKITHFLINFIAGREYNKHEQC